MAIARFFIVLSGSWLIATSFNPLNASYWISGNQLTSCGQKAVELLKHSDEEGLDPEDYHFAITAVAHAQEGGSSKAASDALTQAMSKYVNDIRNGRFNPRFADKMIVNRPRLIDARGIVLKGISSKSCAWMSQQAPSHIEYEQLKLLYRKYAALKERGKWPYVATDVKIYPRTLNSNIKAVREILGRLGDLPANQTNMGSFYNNGLVAAVKRFQYRHALRPNGVIDKHTAKEMNKTPVDRIRQIQVTMERWRWMPRNPGNRYIVVNVAGYHLEAVQNGRVVMSSPLVAGADYRETPVFTTIMTAVTFNPSWHVPHNLAIQDILPELQKSPSYIESHDMVLSKRIGSKIIPVSPYSINWAEYSRSYFPFSIRQRPGAKNPLGKIRFTTHNPYEIFIHSTADQYHYLFDYPVRAFSSGCIRVKNIVDLAYFAFNDPQYWSRDRIEREMQGTETKIYDLKRKVPVYVTYFTVWVDQDGVPHFMPDVYGQDRRVWQVIQKK